MRHFKSLRTEPWEPKFATVAQDNTYGIAAKINVWHEDYPNRVDDTEREILAATIGQGTRAEKVKPRYA